MILVEYITITWLLLSAIMFSVPERAHFQSPQLDFVRRLVLVLTVVITVGFQMLAAAQLSGWTYLIGLALVLALLMTATRYIMQRSDRLCTLALILVVPGILLAFGQLEHIGPIHHR